MTLTLHRDEVRRGELRLVSAAHPLINKDAGPLCPLGWMGDERVKLAAQPAAMLRQLLASCGLAGRVKPVSGYRNEAEQRDIFEEELRSKGEAFTRRYVALPGCSEHHTGLAIDLGRNSSHDFVRPSLPYSGLFGYMRSMMPQFGFVERYPKGKTEWTGIAWEPWHFRYVGRPHALLMHEAGWTLEEYLGEVRRHESYEEALVAGDARIFHCRFAAKEQLHSEIPAGLRYSVSGDNIDGVVVTVWQR